MPSPPFLRRCLAAGPLLLAACARGEAVAAERAPDVLVVTLDALPAANAGFLGAPESATPALDALAARALVLDGATAPWALPALASWASGMPVEAHRCEGPAGVLDAHFTTLAERMLAAGYETACIVSDVLASSQHGLEQGFVQVDEALAFPEVDPLLARPSQALADRAIRFVDQRAAAGGPPWLLWVHWVVPPGTDADTAELDTHLGRVLERVGARGRDAVIVVASATRAPAGAPAPAALLVAAPGLAPQRSQREARPIDLLPTVLALAGLPPPTDLPGRSVVP